MSRWVFCVGEVCFFKSRWDIDPVVGMGTCGTKEPERVDPVSRPIANREPSAVNIHVPRTRPPEEDASVEVTKPMRTKRHVAENTVSLDLSTISTDELREFVELFPSQSTLQQLYIRKSDAAASNLFRSNLPLALQLLRLIGASRLQLLELSLLPASEELNATLEAVLTNNSTLETLNLHLTRPANVKTEVATVLCKALSSNMQLVTLDLSNTDLGPKAVEMLNQILKSNTSLKTLKLVATGLGESGADLAETLRVNKSLATVDLSHNDIGDNGGRKIARALAENMSISKLSLNDVQLSKVGPFFKALQNNLVLRDLSLRGNRLGADGAAALAKLIKLNTTLRSLDVSNCQLGALGAKWLAKNLQTNTTLTTLKLASNNMGPSGVKVVLTALATSKVSTLDISDNNLGLKGDQPILRLLKKNNFLTEVVVGGNGFSPTAEAKIEDLVTYNQGLRDGFKIVPRLLQFPIKFEEKTQAMRTFTIHNMKKFALAFAVLTNNPETTAITPNQGYLEPGCNVKIKVLLMGKFPADQPCNHLFLVRIASLTAEAQAQLSPREFWNMQKVSSNYRSSTIRAAWVVPKPEAQIAKKSSDLMALVANLPSTGNVFKEEVSALKQQIKAGDVPVFETEQAIDEQLSKLVEILSQPQTAAEGKPGTVDQSEEVTSLKRDLQAIQAKLKAIQTERANPKSPSKAEALEASLSREEADPKVEVEEEEEAKSEEEGEDTLKEFRSPGSAIAGEDMLDVAPSPSRVAVAAVDFALAKTMWDETEVAEEDGDEHEFGEFGLDFNLTDFDPTTAKKGKEPEPEVEFEGGVPPAPPMSPPTAPPPPMFDMPIKETPANNLKKFHWTTLAETEAASGVFAELDHGRVKLDTDEIVRLFSQKSEAKGTTTKKIEPAKPQLVDPKKSYNLSIALARCKLPVSTIKTALFDMDSTVMPEEVLESLLKYAPTKDELRNCCQYTGNAALLGPTELFFRDVGEIPQLKVRLQLLLFKTTFDESTEMVLDSLKVVDHARKQIHDSTNLKKILEVILALGNFMNSGQAKGFQLSSLSHLKSSKAQDNKTTLLTFLIQHVRKNCPEAQDFVRDCSSVKPASLVETSFVTSELKSVLANLQTLEQELKRAMQAADPKDKFVSSMLDFYKSARARAKKLTLARNRIVQETAELMLSYGVSSSEAQNGWENFFKLWSSFFDDFTSGVSALEAQVEEAKAQEARKKRSEAFKSPAGKYSSQSDNSVSSTSGDASVGGGSSSSAASKAMSNLIAARRTSMPREQLQFSEPKAQAILLFDFYPLLSAFYIFSLSPLSLSPLSLSLSLSLFFSFFLSLFSLLSSLFVFSVFCCPTLQQ